jgi:hypothetical protein
MSGGRMDSFLNSIPGYGGYRSKEQRRESDRLIRERLANDYGQLADRLGRLATRYADERDIASVRAINKPHTRLVTFRDRVRTATYGYAPLFSQNSIDERALEQIAAFDESLGEGLEPLSASINKLETMPAGTDEFASTVGELEAVVESLHDRFARRSEIFEKGSALEPEKVAGLLGPEPGQAEVDRRPTAYSLHDGEAITFGGQNFTVIGRVTVDMESGSRRFFQLNGGTGNAWLGIPESAAGEFQWLERVRPEGKPGDERIRIGDTAFDKVSEERGSSEVIGTLGASGEAQVTYFAYRGFSGNEIIHVYDWGVDSLALRGARIDPMEVQLWSREGRDAI